LDSRKAFLTKICVCAVAVGALPRLLLGRKARPVPDVTATPPGIAVRPDKRAVARNGASV
jgi:hypothetical protein